MPRFTLLPLLALPLIACQPASDTDLSARFDALDERLTSIETKLDDATSKVDEVAAWATARREEEERKRKEREELRAERDARRAELEAKRTERREARRKLREAAGEDPLAPSPRLGEDETAELISEGIRCEPPGETQQLCSIDKALVEELLSNPARLSKQARVVPRVRDGEADGFKLYGIRPGSVPKALGMKNGDTVRMVNGSALLSIDDAMAMYMKLRKANQLELEIERKGKVFDLVIDILE